MLAALLTLDPATIGMLTSAAMLAPDGRCKTLDAAADGCDIATWMRCPTSVQDIVAQCIGEFAYFLYPLDAAMSEERHALHSGSVPRTTRQSNLASWQLWLALL